jgi:hypothetical protein
VLSRVQQQYIVPCASAAAGQREKRVVFRRPCLWLACLLRSLCAHKEWLLLLNCCPSKRASCTLAATVIATPPLSVQDVLEYDDKRSNTAAAAAAAPAAAASDDDNDVSQDVCMYDWAAFPQRLDSEPSSGWRPSPAPHDESPGLRPGSRGGSKQERVGTGRYNAGSIAALPDSAAAGVQDTLGIDSYDAAAAFDDDDDDGLGDCVHDWVPYGSSYEGQLGPTAQADSPNVSPGVRPGSRRRSKHERVRTGRHNAGSTAELPDSAAAGVQDTLVIDLTGQDPAAEASDGDPDDDDDEGLCGEDSSPDWVPSLQGWLSSQRRQLGSIAPDNPNISTGRRPDRTGSPPFSGSRHGRVRTGRQRCGSIAELPDSVAPRQPSNAAGSRGSHRPKRPAASDAELNIRYLLQKEAVDWAKDSEEAAAERQHDRADRRQSPLQKAAAAAAARRAGAPRMSAVIVDLQAASVMRPFLGIQLWL